MRVDAAAFAVLRAPQYRSYNRRAYDTCCIDHPRKLPFRRALRFIEHGRSRANRSHPDLDLNAQFSGMLPNPTQVFRFQTSDKPDLGKVYYLDMPRGAIIQVLNRCPFLRAQAEEIDAQL